MEHVRWVAAYCGVGAVAIAVAAGGRLEAQVTPPWSDGFEAYSNGSGIAGQGGWEAWDDDPAFDSFVSTAQAHSGTKSLDVSGASDTVMRFNDVTCGEWTLTASVYIPSDHTGKSHFLMLNTYNHLGPYHWSTWVSFSGGITLDELGGNTLPYNADAWNDIRVVINLDDDTQDFFFNGEPLYEGKSWTEGWNVGGLPEIQCLDLFAEGSTSVFYDDIAMQGDCVAPDLDLSFNRLVGGQPTTFTVTGALPDNNIVVLYALGLRSRPVEGQSGNFCALVGINIDLQNPTANLACQGRSDSDGEMFCSMAIPRQGTGRHVYFQAFQANTCPAPSHSDIADGVIQ